LDFACIAGPVAALCSVISFTPQAFKIIRTGETKDLSAAMYVLTVAGFGDDSAADTQETARCPEAQLEDLLVAELYRSHEYWAPGLRPE
jgi:hypothetical protein